jgi:hypothetical protein
MSNPMRFEVVSSWHSMPLALGIGLHSFNELNDVTSWQSCNKVLHNFWIGKRFREGAHKFEISRR